MYGPGCQQPAHYITGPENMMHTTSGCRSSDEEERGSCSAASVMDSGSRIGGDSRHNEVEVFNCPWRISPPQSCSRHSSGFGPGNLPCELSGRGRFSRRHSRTEGGLHLYLSAAAILLLACLVSSPEAVPIPAKAPSEVRTLETDWRREIYDEPVIEDSQLQQSLLNIPAILVGDMLEPAVNIAALAVGDEEGQAENNTHNSALSILQAEDDDDDADRHGSSRRELSWEWNHDESRRYRRGTATNYRGLWENATIPFAFESSLRTEAGQIYGVIREAIRKAMRMWEDSTCIRFVPRINNYHKNSIVFTKAPSDKALCSSYVGRTRGIQPIGLSSDCWTSPGIIMHELGHAIGFFHEQQRPDRDDYVKVFMDNIRQGDHIPRAFAKRADLESYNVSYDIDSIMHYGNYDFSRDPLNLKTIEVRNDPNYRLGQREYLTDKDIEQTNRMYGCPFPETCHFRKQPIRAARLISLVVRHSKGRIKWLSCRHPDGRCRRMTCSSLSQLNCTESPNACGSELFAIEPDPNRLPNHKVYAHDRIMLRSHVQRYSAKAGRRRRRSNVTREGFLACRRKDGFKESLCQIEPCNSNNPYADCPNSVFFFLPAHQPRKAREESNLSIDDPLEAEITENTPVGLCQEDKNNIIHCVRCPLRSSGSGSSLSASNSNHPHCYLQSCGPSDVAASSCGSSFLQLRQWVDTVQPRGSNSHHSEG